MLVIPISDVGRISFDTRWSIIRIKFKGKALREPEALRVSEAKLVDRDNNIAIWLDSGGKTKATYRTLRTVTSVGRKAEIDEALKKVKLLEA